MLSTIVSIANLHLYNLANSVQRHLIKSSELRHKHAGVAEPPHVSLRDFDTGDECVEVMLRDDFYSSVLPTLGLHNMINAKDQIASLDQFFADIGVLARYSKNKTSKKTDIKVLRFAVLAAAWQVHGYEFSNLKRLKRINGLNFNMLSVKSIRILNRLSARLQAYRKIYEARA